MKQSLLFFGLCVWSLVLVAQPAPTRTKEVFTDTIIANNAAGLDSPWEITYESKEDSLWITENRTYRIRKMHPNGGSRVILDLSQTGSFPGFRRTFNSSQNPWPQGGMMGFAIHPKFLDPVTPKNFVYVAYVRQFIGAGPANISGTGVRQTATNPNTGEAVKGDLFITYLVRFNYNATTKVLENPVALCDTITGSNDHNSGRLIIAPVGSEDFLFYSVGDMGAGQFYSAERTNKAQMINSYEGKILRFKLEPDVPAESGLDGWIPNDNPYNNVAPVSGQSAVWSIGHRNVQGFAYANNTLYGSSHGPFSDDEVNVLTAGKNYGHPRAIGEKGDGNYNNARAAQATFRGWNNEFSVPNALVSSLPLITNEAADIIANYQDPIYSFFKAPNGPAGTAGTVLNIYNTNPGNSGWPSIAPSGMDAYTNTKIPGWKNSLLLASLKRGFIMRIKPNAAGTGVESIDGSDTAVILNTQNRFRDLAFDPDGLTIYAVVDRSGSTSGPTSTNPVTSVCPGCVIKYKFLGYTPSATNPFPSSIPSNIAIDSATINTCVPGSTVIINNDNKNNNLWVPITGPNGDVVAEIDANNNNLGIVTTSFYVKTGATRSQGGKPYMNRNITITPEFQPVTAVNVRLYYTQGEFNNLKLADPSIMTTTDVAILKNDDNCGAAYGGGIISKPAITGRYVQGTFGHALQTSITSFSTFYFANANSTLPFNLITFTGTARGETAKLQWTVSNENDQLTGYEVERSTDNVSFEIIGSVAAKGIGTDRFTYYFTDLSAAKLSSVVYYRLKTKDQDGSLSYTSSVRISFVLSNIYVSLFPNPAGNITSVRVNSAADETAQISIIDNTGRIVHQKPIVLVKGINNFELELNDLRAGIYYINLTSKTITQKIKLIKK